jgi:hypothetical protein
MQAMDNTPKPLKDEKGRFVTGNIGGGRPKGSRNKLGEAFTDALYADFQEHGPAAIQEMRANDPSGYCRVIAGLLPKELKVEAKPLDQLTDDQLDDIISAIRTADGATISVAGRKAEAGGKARFN